MASPCLHFLHYTTTESKTVHLELHPAAIPTLRDARPIRLCRRKAVQRRMETQSEKEEKKENSSRPSPFMAMKVPGKIRSCLLLTGLQVCCPCLPLSAPVCPCLSREPTHSCESHGVSVEQFAVASPTHPQTIRRVESESPRPAD